MKIWVDDVRDCPLGYCISESVNLTKKLIEYCESFNIPIELIDLDHDAGDYAKDGGDYIKILDWLEETGRHYPIRIHSANPVGIANMRRIIERNGWEEVK